MPIHVDTIVATSKPLDEKIYEVLAGNPDQFFTLQELKTALGEFQGFTVIGSKISPSAMLVGLFADVALSEPVGELMRKREEELATALSALVEANRIQCVNYLGELRFGVSKALPGWVAQPKISVK